MRWMFFSIIALVPAIALAQDAKTPQPDKDYTEVIKDTAVKIDMVRIPGGTIKTSPGSMKDPPTLIPIKPFWIAKSETTWEQYDTYHLQLDLPKDQRKFVKWPAAKTRPSPPYDRRRPTYGLGKDGVIGRQYGQFALQSRADVRPLNAELTGRQAIDFRHDHIQPHRRQVDGHSDQVGVLGHDGCPFPRRLRMIPKISVPAAVAKMEMVHPMDVGSGLS